MFSPLDILGEDFVDRFLFGSHSTQPHRLGQELLVYFNVCCHVRSVAQSLFGVHFSWQNAEATNRCNLRCRRFRKLTYYSLRGSFYEGGQFVLQLLAKSFQVFFFEHSISEHEYHRHKHIGPGMPIQAILQNSLFCFHSFQGVPELFGRRLVRGRQYPHQLMVLFFQIPFPQIRNHVTKSLPIRLFGLPIHSVSIKVGAEGQTLAMCLSSGLSVPSMSTLP